MIDYSTRDYSTREDRLGTPDDTTLPWQVIIVSLFVAGLVICYLAFN